jgi:hypothetical protein
LRVAAIGSAWSVFLIYLAHATVLVAYPWDWSPDEGLTLDYARRLVEAPATLYAKTVVPVPLEYTPLLTVVLAPIVAASPAPLGPARVVALSWTCLLVAGIYALVRSDCPNALALAVAALSLAPLDLTFWYMLLRIDGLMIALWVWSAVFLLPRSLAPGADHLGLKRLLLGAGLLLAAVLTKPTAVVHGAPLVLVWLWVGLMTAAGLGVALALNLLSAGGFLWVNSLWATHISIPGQGLQLLVLFASLSGWILAWAMAGVAVAWRWGIRVSREPALLLVAGGLAMAPGMGKIGAFWNYLLPAFVGIVVLGGRTWGAATSTRGGEATALGLTTALALMLALSRTFPLPTLVDERTAAAYYGFLKARVTETGRGLLANRPDYAYFHAGLPVEIDGSHFVFHAASGLPGAEKVTERLTRGEYSVVSEEPIYWPRGPFRFALDTQYRRLAVCGIGFFYGIQEFILHVPREAVVTFAPPPGTRCRLVPAQGVP